MNPLRKAGLVLRHLGPGWVWFRVRYACRRRIGGLRRRSPAVAWPAVERARGAPLAAFATAPAAIGAGSMAEADAILAGRFRLFSGHEVEAGFPPVWNRNPHTGETAPLDRHWSELGDFAFGDIKGIWELNRFPWAFALGRAWARTRDNRYAEAFWTLFDDWMERNPPNVGPAWMCGQESSFRLMAAMFARFACAAAPATTPERVVRFAQLVTVTARRVDANLDYALSQANNHGVSECTALITGAVLVPGAAEAKKWRVRGLAELERQLGALVYPDGAFAQHSAVYHRVLLHDVLWTVNLLRVGGDTAPEWLLAAGRRALAFIAALLDPATGRVPLYGANDGSNVLPLADADYLDFRPLVQAGYAVLHGERRLMPGPWDEAAEWLAPDPPYVESALEGDGRRHFPDGGGLHWRRQNVRLFFRCPTRFRHRPSQADLLHVSIEWREQPIAIDPGTYSYNTPGRFAGAMKEAAVHNTVTFGSEEPMTKLGRFLYLPWPLGAAGAEGADAFGATHDAWSRLAAGHGRTIRAVGADTFDVEDRLYRARPGRVAVHWLLADYKHQLEPSTLRLATPRGAFTLRWRAPTGARVSLVRAEPASNRGWQSPRYGEAVPALSLVIDFEFSGDAMVTTSFGPG